MQTAETTLIASMAASLRTRLLRSIAEFAEQEIILPDGPYEGRRFRLSRSPIARLFFEEYARGHWERIFGTGPNQDGKSLILFVIPTLYTLFELRETALLGVPSLEMAADKWTIDLLPTIKASRFASLLPTSGKGSRDGDSVLYEFGNGARLRFMTAGGGDQARASFTSKNLFVTETDGFDKVGGSSREGDKFSQLERRLLAFGDRARVLAECTVSTETGRTWQEYQHGTRSRIALPCPHCGEYVTPEREHLKGWQEAKSEEEAIQRAAVCCPSCGSIWTNDERIQANHKAKLVHKGQSVTTDGRIIGPPPQTKTLGFRWTVINSILNPERVARVGRDEWRSKRSTDEEVTERDLCQKEWALPAKAAVKDLTKLDAAVIAGRTLPYDRGVCPPNTLAVTAAIDIGEHRCHWVVIAWLAGATPHVIDYGIVDVDSGDKGPDASILSALLEWRETVVKPGWTDGATKRQASFVFVDAGNWALTIYAFCNKSGPRFVPTKGYGIGQRDETQDSRKGGSTVLLRGDHYAVVELPDHQQYLEVDANYWKAFTHDRAKTPLEASGAFTLFAGKDHFSYCKHLLAERKEETFSPQHGRVIRMRLLRENNHWLDATALAEAAGSMAGMKLQTVALPAPTPPPQPIKRDDDTGWVGDTSNWRT
jgi:hypothetical protein